MGASLFSNLAWLPQQPDDVRNQIRTLGDRTGDLGNLVRALASYALDENHLTSLANAIEKARSTGRCFTPLEPFRLGLISNGTLEFMVPALVSSAARHGILLECFRADYGQVVQDAINPNSKINISKPDAVLIALDFHAMPSELTFGDAEKTQASVDRTLQYVDTIREGIRNNSGAISIVQTIARTAEDLFGSIERIIVGAPNQIIASVNNGLIERIGASEDLLLDVAGIAETVGLAAWHDPTLWNIAKVPFSSSFLPLYADHVARLIAALRGKSRRCLVLDLDNTLWGGVVGDDGLEGIVLAQGDPTGEAYLSIQRFALSLRQRGIVLAVSSKNDDHVARRVFREHPEMLLREEDIAVFQANWNDKASNLKAIADELALGLESLVFLDDNPVERDFVRRVLPEVAVPELPVDPALYARTLAAAGYFDITRFTHDDRTRADFYQANARRASLQKQVGDLKAYLASLDMEITFQPFDSIGLPRIAQLINKSNQFNLTTRRYTEVDVALMRSEPDCFTMQVRLKDSFGDNGMICVIICREQGRKAWSIDTWLMSCRVLGRGVERMVLREIIHHARRKGIKTLIGTFRPTGRNAMVSQHYRTLGFTYVEGKPHGETIWELPTSAEVEPAPMKINRRNFELATSA